MFYAEFSANVACMPHWLGPTIAIRCVYYTSGFVDDVIIAHNVLVLDTDRLHRI